jgi:hypothetical protein
MLLDARDIISSSVNGTALLADPTKPVTPRTLRTRCQLSSVMIILIRTYPGKTFLSTVLGWESWISVTVPSNFDFQNQFLHFLFSAAFSIVAATAFFIAE